MRKIIALLVGSLVVGCYFFSLYGQSLRNELQSLHREIGNNLIRIKKDYPKSQTVVYSVLDKLGKYYSFSKELMTKKKEYKRQFTSEKKRADQLAKESEAMKEKIAKMSQVMRKVSRKIQNEYVKVDEINDAKASLTKEREAFLQEKEELIREKEKLINERNALLQEREAILQQQGAGVPAGGFNPQKSGDSGDIEEGEETEKAVMRRSRRRAAA